MGLCAGPFPLDCFVVPRTRPLFFAVRCLCLAALGATAVTAQDLTHKVKPGETLGAIAERHGATVRELQDLNGIRDPKTLQIGQEIKLPAKDRAYTVLPGDALSKIARDHGVTVQQILDLNQLSNADTLRVGQVLRIPLTRATYKPGPVLLSSLRRELDQIKIARGKWKYIVIHHSASRQGSTAGMDRYHREKRRMENGLAYHFVIGNGNGMPNGQIDIGNRWRRQIKGGHVASDALNQKAIGICLVGNFEETAPTQKQMESLEALTRFLMQATGVPVARVRTHTQINTKPTRCPGRRFPTSEFLVKLSR